MSSNSIFRPLSRSWRCCVRQFGSTSIRQRPDGREDNATAALTSSLLDALKSSAARSKANSSTSNTLSSTDPLDPDLARQRSRERSQLLSSIFAKKAPAPSSSASAQGPSKLFANTTAKGGAGTLSPAEALALQHALPAQLPRRPAHGSVYAPHDLSPAEAHKWKKLHHRPAKDVFDLLGASASAAGRRRFSPGMLYRNFALLALFTTETGRIKGRKETGLRAVNQRRMAKAVRRAVGLGLLPSVHRHPEVMRAAAAAGFSDPSRAWA